MGYKDDNTRGYEDEDVLGNTLDESEDEEEEETANKDFQKEEDYE